MLKKIIAAALALSFVFISCSNNASNNAAGVKQVKI